MSKTWVSEWNFFKKICGRNQKGRGKEMQSNTIGTAFKKSSLGNLFF